MVSVHGGALWSVGNAAAVSQRPGELQRYRRGGPGQSGARGGGVESGGQVDNQCGRLQHRIAADGSWC